MIERVVEDLRYEYVTGFECLVECEVGFVRVLKGDNWVGVEGGKVEWLVRVGYVSGFWPIRRGAGAARARRCVLISWANRVKLSKEIHRRVSIESFP